MVFLPTCPRLISQGQRTLRDSFPRGRMCSGLVDWLASGLIKEKENKQKTEFCVALTPLFWFLERLSVKIRLLTTVLKFEEDQSFQHAGRDLHFVAFLCCCPTLWTLAFGEGIKLQTNWNSHSSWGRGESRNCLLFNCLSEVCEPMFLHWLGFQASQGPPRTNPGLALTQHHRWRKPFWCCAPTCTQWVDHERFRNTSQCFTMRFIWFLSTYAAFCHTLPAVLSQTLWSTYACRWNVCLDTRLMPLFEKLFFVCEAAILCLDQWQLGFHTKMLARRFSFSGNLAVPWHSNVLVSLIFQCCELSWKTEPSPALL